jgi:WhiB family redox-sensing transcriptional regulator
VTFTLQRPVDALDELDEHDFNWRDRAACRFSSPDLFFPAGTTGAAQHEIAAAKAVCAECPVQSHCLRFALQTGQDYGIWGGTTEDERVTMRRLTRRPTALPA